MFGQLHTAVHTLASNASFNQGNSTLLLTLKRWYLAWMVMTGQGTPFTMLMSPNRLSWCCAAETAKHWVRCH